jgi:hypothetical protein
MKKDMGALASSYLLDKPGLYLLDKPGLTRYESGVGRAGIVSG